MIIINFAWWDRVPGYIYCKLYKLETVEKNISRYSKSKSHLKTVSSLYI